MKKIIFICFIMPAFLFAKNNGELLKYKMIKLSVEFYTKDTVTFKNLIGKKLDSIDCENDYDCLIKFSNENQLKGVEDNIKKWQNISANTKEDLAGLKDMIIKDLTDKKPERKKINVYNEYEININNIIDEYEANGEIKKIDIFLSTDDSTLILSNGRPAQVKTKTNKLPFIALVLSLIAIAVSLYSLFGKKNISTPTNTNISSDQQELQKLSNKIEILSATDINRINIDIKKIEQRIESLEKKIDTSNKNTNLNKSNEVELSPSINKNIPIIKTIFAMYADNGVFSNDLISDYQNGQQVYEIVVKDDNNAIYKISENEDAQKFALSDANAFLLPACEYLNTRQQSNSKIKSEINGILVKSGNNWVIQIKTKIRFT